MLKHVLMMTTALTVLAASAHAADLTFAPVPVPQSDAAKRAVQASPSVTIDGTEHKIGYHVLYRSGDMGAGTLIDAKGVSRLYQPGMGRFGVAMFAVAFLLLLVIVIAASPGSR